MKEDTMRYSPSSAVLDLLNDEMVEQTEAANQALSAALHALTAAGVPFKLTNAVEEAASHLACELADAYFVAGVQLARDPTRLLLERA